MNAEAIARALEGRRSDSCWMARYPAHDGGGKVLVHCHAGCSQDAVVAVLKDLGASLRATCQNSYRYLTIMLPHTI